MTPISRIPGARTLKSSFSVLSILRSNGDLIARLGDWCFWQIAWIFGDRPPRLLDDDKLPLPNRTTMITADLFEREYVDEAGFILYDAAVLGGPIEPALDTETVHPGTEGGYIGAHIAPEEYPADDPMGADVSDDVDGSDSDEEFFYDRRASEVSENE